MIHTHWAEKGTEQHEIQVIPCTRQNKTSKSAKYPAEDSETGEKHSDMLFVESSFTQKDTGPNDFTSQQNGY